MADKLQEMFDAWKETVTDPTDFQTFQGGVTAGAVSMRERAVAAIQAAKLTDDECNALLSAAGSLSDIPA